MLFLDEWDIQDLEMISAKRLPLGGNKNHKSEWIKKRGLYQEQLYIYPDSNARIVEYYEYTYKEDNREIVSYSRTMKWEDSTGIVHVVDTTPDLSPYHIREVNKSSRKNQIVYLEGAAVDLRSQSTSLSEPYKSQFLHVANELDNLMHRYANQIREYTERNVYTYDFENAVINEVDESILNTLSMRSRPSDNDFPLGLNVKESILYQLTGVIPI